MPAWDNVQLPGSPAAPSYAAPLVDFSPLGKLTDSYFKGTQQGRTRDLQTAFKDGLPKNPDGSLDINAMTDTLARLGGADAAMPLMNLQIQQQLGAGNANAIAGANSTVAGDNSTPGASVPKPAADIPEHGIPSAPGGTGGGYKPVANEASNPDTLANIVQGQITDPAVAGRVIAAASAKLGIDPGQTIDPNNPTLQAYMKAAKGNVLPTGGTAGQPPGGATPAVENQGQGEPIA